jgi:peptidoglycan/LPS O-acetylase OafA/YrhL
LEKQSDPSGRPLHRRVFYAGVAILCAGLIAAVLIYVSTGDAGTDSAAEIASGRSYEFQIERIGGKATVYVVRFNQWLGGLWHGRQLAYTVAVLSVVIALACFWVAGQIAARSKVDEDQDGAE